MSPRCIQKGRPPIRIFKKILTHLHCSCVAVVSRLLTET